MAGSIGPVRDVGWRPAVVSGALVCAGLLAWLWPIGVGGKMPVGGDVTSFSIGLLAEFGRAVRAGRIPEWNDLWGYGFPGLAESQMGVYYPPNALFFGLLPAEAGYTAGLVLHTLWAGLGAAWASRRFGAGAWGSAVAGLAFGTSGFFLAHLPHHWGAATAGWMPWAWGLAWSVATGAGGARSALGLAAVLAIQLLPGHFQLAFITEATTLLVGLGGIAARGESGPRWHRGARLAGALLATAPLAMAQLAPTAELARLAASDHDAAYLGAFASPPLHLVSYVAPGLFHESPLWRPLAWDAFHAMPEEHLATVGLVPLFLAWLAIRRGGRDPAVRALVVAAIAATWFGLGPYAPGFEALCRLPGFSFFRAPSRWGSAAMLALAILAGRGFDGIWPASTRPEAPARAGRSLRRFVLVAAAWPALVLGLFEVALLAHEPVAGRPAWPAVAGALDRAFGLIPWPDNPALPARLAATRRPLDDLLVPVALARQGRPFDGPDDRILARRRGPIYAQELGPTAAFLALLLVASLAGPRSPRLFALALASILVAEAACWSRRRPFDLGPIRPLAGQSPVLGRVAELPRGTRWVGPGRNLPMLVSAAPISAYRTLDLPSLPELTALAEGPGRSPETAGALRAAGVGVRIVQGGEPARPPGWETIAEVDDPALLGWLTGADWVRALGERAPSRFLIQTPSREPARAWLVSGPGDDLPSADEDSRRLLPALAKAAPVGVHSPRPEERTMTFEAGGPGVVVLTELAYPRWRASLAGASGVREVPIRRVARGAQAVDVPSSGSWTLRMTYDTTPDRVALGVSGLAWVAWVLLYWRAGRTVVAPGSRSSATTGGVDS